MIGYDKTISPDENMVAPDEDAYFQAAETAFQCILNGLASTNRSVESITSVLDFGCGHGRVYRTLVSGFPNARFTSCDLIEAGARFCAETFGGTWVKSHEDVKKTRFDTTFDLIWLGSVFTHLPRHRWHAMLDFLASISDPGGAVVFSVHGESAIRFMESYILKRNPYLMPGDEFQKMKKVLPDVGFYFSQQAAANHRYSVEHGMDVSAGEYGLAFTTEAWIRNLIEKKPEWRLENYAAPGWGKNHDAVTLVRT